MTLSEDVFAALTTGSPMPLRVYPDVLPPLIQLPACTYQVVAGVDEFHLLGRAGLGRILVRVDVWSTMASSNFSVTGIDITGADGFEEDTERYRASREFIIWRES